MVEESQKGHNWGWRSPLSRLSDIDQTERVNAAGLVRLRFVASTETTAQIDYVAPAERLRIAVYSDDVTVREAIEKALGKRVSTQHPEHEILYFATGVALKEFARGKKAAHLYILDGEAVPEGGMGIARQLKDEIFNCPPTMVITGRVQDAWLAGWSGADAVVTHPIDPFTLAKSVAQVLS